MASLDVIPIRRGTDCSALPWPLMGAALALSSFGLLLSRVLDSEPAMGRLLLLGGGLLCAGIAVAIRLNSTAPAMLNRVAGPSREPLLLGLAGLFALLVLAATAIVVLTFFDLPWLPFGTGSALILWFVVAPLGSTTAYRVQRLTRFAGAITPQEETAAVLFLTALCGFATSWALYRPADPADWDTMRTAVAVFSSVALIAAPLPLASMRVRRWTISVLVVLHFGGIASATLSAPPTPWLVGQVWIRIYRPYLEFMYLNNAYHFYAPEPGPPSYLWCRLIYADANGKEWGEWYKVPDIDENGQHHHKVALEYQRYLALTEQLVSALPTPPFVAIGPDGKETQADFYKRREAWALGDVIGLGKTNRIVPFHPLYPHAVQYSLPTASTQKLLKSYAQHVAKYKSEPPDYLQGCTFAGVKLYRVRHDIPRVDYYAKLDPPLPANDPELYYPYYMGRYDKDGEIMDAPQVDKLGNRQVMGDPFLFWLLPVLRINSTDQHSPIRDYARFHAGDAKWIYVPDENKWIEEPGNWVEKR